jgi:hypothetical protein
VNGSDAAAEAEALPLGPAEFDRARLAAAAPAPLPWLLPVPLAAGDSVARGRLRGPDTSAAGDAAAAAAATNSFGPRFEVVVGDAADDFESNSYSDIPARCSDTDHRGSYSSTGEQR